MIKTRFVILICLCGTLALQAAPLSPETIRRKASDLLFYLGSDDTTVSQERLDFLMSKEDDAVGMLYKRAFENRMKYKKTREYISKQKELKDQGFYHFKNWELRQAVIDLLFELGDGALEVLLESIHSARQGVVLGVIKAVDAFQDHRIVLLMSDVLELDKWGRSKFSSLVRRQGVYVLRKYTDQEMARNLLGEVIVDLDPMVRQIAQEVVGKAEKDHPDFVESTYVKAYSFELDLIKKMTEEAKAKGALDALEDNAFSVSSMSLLLENMAIHIPSAFEKIHIPEDLLTRRGLVRTFLVHHKVLPDALRIKVLDRVMEEPTNNLVLLDALKAMRESDGKRFLSKMGPCLDIKNSPAVIHQALQLCGVWGVQDYRKEIQLIAKSARQENLRDLAKLFLETL
jgi:hypothetical protein